MNIILDGEISPRGRGSAWLRDQLTGHTGDVELHVNSPGGDVHEGVAMLNVLRAHPGRVTAIVEGLAASAASFIIAGGADHIIMRPHSEVMVHSPWMALEGDGPTLVKAAGDLERLGGTLARIYADRAGGTPERWAELMSAETWFTADEAVAAGLADEVVDGRTAVTAANHTASPVFARFRYRSRAEAPQPNTKDNDMAEQQPEQSADGVVFTPEQWTKLTTLLDVDPAAATVDEALDLIAAMVEKLVGDNPEKTDSEGGAVLARAGRVLLDRDTYKELVAGAREGIAIRAQRDAKAREAEVDQWIREGRINSSFRAKAVAMAHRDMATARAFYGSNPPNTIPVKEIGHALTPDDEAETGPSNWVR